MAEICTELIPSAVDKRKTSPWPSTSFQHCRSIYEQFSLSLAFEAGKVAECTAYIRFSTRLGRIGKPMHRVSDTVRSTHGQDGAIVLDVQQGQMFNLNLVGSKILELLESGSAESEIVTVISREFNSSQEVVEKDVCEFIESLKKHKLITNR